jgi:uncharacterized protein (DUF111 family)
VCRIVLLEEETPGDDPTPQHVHLLEANLDDLTPELTAHAIDALLDAGALDAWACPATMKKGRPGVVLSALAAPEASSALEEVFFRETTTFGVRRRLVARSTLARSTTEVPTSFGPVRVKVGKLRGRVVSAVPEYGDCVARARERGVAVRRVYGRAGAIAQHLIEDAEPENAEGS